MLGSDGGLVDQNQPISGTCSLGYRGAFDPHCHLDPVVCSSPAVLCLACAFLEVLIVDKYGFLVV